MPPADHDHHDRKKRKFERLIADRVKDRPAARAAIGLLGQYRHQDHHKNGC